MPLYEYECQACQKRFEVIRKFSDPPIEVCTLCGKGPVQRLLSTPAIQFKGTGWYITDYSNKGKAPSDGSSTKSDGKTPDAGTTDTSSATKADSSSATASTASKPASSET